MPYIKQNRRKEAKNNPQTVGELNYAITCQCLASQEECLLSDSVVRLCAKYIIQQPTIDYDTLNGVVGAIESARLEYFSRLGDLPPASRVDWALVYARNLFYYAHVVPYEDRKIKENGDVY